LSDADWIAKGRDRFFPDLLDGGVPKGRADSVSFFEFRLLYSGEKTFEGGTGIQSARGGFAGVCAHQIRYNLRIRFAARFQPPHNPARFSSVWFCLTFHLPVSRVM